MKWPLPKESEGAGLRGLAETWQEQSILCFPMRGFRLFQQRPRIVPSSWYFLLMGPRIFSTEEEWWLETMAPLSGIIDTSERGNATTWLSFEKIFYQGDFPGCCVIGGGIS